MNNGSRHNNKLFVSYCQRDDRPKYGESSGWITQFRIDLRNRLAEELGEDPEIWIDRFNLRGNDDFAKKILNEISNSAALIAVLSRGYCRSDWCMKELRHFCRVAEQTGGLEIDLTNRIFKVQTLKLQDDELPEPLGDLLGHKFFEEDEAGISRTFSRSTKSKAYKDKIGDLAFAISNLLKLFAGLEPPLSNPTQTVYLAECTSDLEQVHDTLRRFLDEKGCSVLPNRVLPTDGPQAKATIRASLQKCCLSIHLLGKHYGVIPESETESIVELQDRLAAERSMAEPEFRRFIWLPPGLANCEERQAQFIERLRTSPEAQQGAEILQTSLEELKFQIEEKFKPKPCLPASANGELTRIYLVCDRRDKESARQLKKDLFSRGYEVILPILESNELDQAEVRQHHEQSLARCDGILVYWGQAGEDWLEVKLNDLRRISSLDRQGRPLRAKAICLMPPATPCKQGLLTREAEVIDCSSGFSPAQLEPFLHQLDGGQGAMTG